MLSITIHGGVTINVDGNQRCILDTLEQHKLQVNYHCREGYCGACRCKLLSGNISYTNEPLAFVRAGEFLPCCSVSLSDIIIEIP
ncbi:class I ribonucleotide reductase maintenance protein YfaE [Rheinheimera maricola]|uniref:2Fe-2S ferredoxin-like protein n=1 Tax=Rheinheimera maricola TaxID=2793282 RepID=A0ABS7X848_9GAMM|nr:class I ribonucleotide reductase maintenance protein YfaE [Rheinheimera maricola]MBZ9610977.1 2Fe-2S ferredoxin-like protein [Rheinheimera maricola]